ncbi:MAG: methylated-DNA--[protein]-cysteine S-methyltransferase [Actinocrinis sp.]
MADLTAHRTDTPLGPFTILADGEVVRASGFTTSVEQLARLAGVALDAVAVSGEDHPALAAVREYFGGEVAAIDRVKTMDKPRTGPFTVVARHALRDIPAGTTHTYSELAIAAGNPKAVRAAGSACATNPTALFVPCHRVTRTDGSLGGFLYGLDVKRALIEHEAKYAAA